MEYKRRRVVVLGSTGSIGTAAIEILSAAPERFEVAGIAAGGNVERLRAQLAAFPEARFAVRDDAVLTRLTGSDADLARRCAGTGGCGLAALIDDPAPDLVVNALVGIAGLEPSVLALEAGCLLALANKESLVAGGDVIARIEGGAQRILPVDSEHFSLSRCLQGRREDSLELVLTASGGPFHGRDQAGLGAVTVEEVLAHPTWKMGNKVTVDSAHLLNKGLEVIEAHQLFGFPYESISVVIHPQSLVHGMIRLTDGSFIAHVGPADMRLPLMSALYHPEMTPFPWGALALHELDRLEFERFEPQRYPAYVLALEAARAGGTAPAVLNAADETAVAAFLEEKIGFLTIVDWIEEALAAHTAKPVASIGDVMAADRWTREFLARRHPGAGAP